MADQENLVEQEKDVDNNEAVDQGADVDGISADPLDAQEEDMGELNFNSYDAALLEGGDEEEATATLDTRQQEQEDQESERRKKEQSERNWGPNSAHALPAHKSELPAHSRHSNSDHADRQRNYQRSQRPYLPSRDSQPNRGREPMRGRSNFSQGQGREGFQDQGRRAEGARAPSHPSAPPPRRQQPTGTSSMSHQYPRPVPPSRQNQGEQDFDPNILSSLVGGMNPLQMLGPAPSFAPDVEEPSHKRTHEQMQQMPPMAHLLTPGLIQSLHQLRQQQPQQERHPHQQQAWPGAPPNGSHMPPHNMMGAVIPPPRPPQGPPPPGQPPHIPHSGYGPPNFGPMTSNAMDGRPYQSPPQDSQGFRHRQGPPGWSLSHGMDGSDRSGNRQEPMLAADMVWDSDAGQGHPSSQSAGGPRADAFRGHMAGQRNGLAGAGPYSAAPRMPPARPAAPIQNKAAEAAKNQAALAAAKARFEQQQKENDEIAERNKRQRLGLPEPRPAVPETEIERLKRQIAEKEAAKKAAQAQTPTVTKSAPPSPAKGRAASLSPSSLPEGSTPPPSSGKSHRLQSAVVKVQPSVPIDQNDRWRPQDEGHSRSRDAGKAFRSVEAEGRGRRNGDDSSHKHHDHRGASRDSSRDRGHRDRHREDHHRSQRAGNGSTQRSDANPSQDDSRHREMRDQDRGMGQ